MLRRRLNTTQSTEPDTRAPEKRESMILSKDVQKTTRFLFNASRLPLLLSLAACSSSSSAGTSNEGGSADAEGTSDDSNTIIDGNVAADGAHPHDADSSDASGTGSGRAVNLGTAGTYVILAKSGISSVPTSAVTGDIGVSPSAATYITGFSLTADATNVFSTSPQVTGHVFASDYATPTPSNLTTAVADMQLAFTDAAGAAPKVTELGAGNIGGMTLSPGVYKWSSGLLIPTSVTLAGSATDYWIFEIAQGLTVSNATNVTLSGGAVASHVVWQVSGQVTLGTTARFVGIVLGQTSIAVGTGASITGRLFAQTAVTIQSATVTAP
jgi:hypothetical protein